MGTTRETFDNHQRFFTASSFNKTSTRFTSIPPHSIKKQYCPLPPSVLLSTSLLLKIPRHILLFFTIVFTSTLLSASQTYILSYRTQIKNAAVISESYQFSKAMTQIKAVKAESLSLYSPDETSLNAILHVYKDEILEFLMKYGVHTRSHENIRNLKSASLLQLTLPPTYITVDFNDDYATITRLITE